MINCARDMMKQKKEKKRKAVILLYNHSDVVEQLIPNPKVIYSEKRSSETNKLTLIPLPSLFFFFFF